MHCSKESRQATERGVGGGGALARYRVLDCVLDCQVVLDPPLAQEVQDVHLRGL